jgi:MFS-type transporter involved in bile tolerance (Atg22 family)
MALTILTYIIAGITQSAFLYLGLSVVLGITNAGARVMRTTWLFEHVPNQRIGRVSSVFQTINILNRVALSALCSLPFFHTSNNIRYTYFLCALIVLIYMIPLMLRYTRLSTLKQNTGN